MKQVPLPENATRLGESRLGQQILMWSYGSGPAQVVVIGGTHGDEDRTPGLVERLRDDVAEREAEISGLTVHFIPYNNPDGFMAGTRVNAAGVDPNRNFPVEWSATYRSKRNYPGEQPLSEPESALIADLIERIRPARILSIHSPLDLIDYDGEEGLRLARLMSAKNGMKVATVGYPTPGSLGRFCLSREVPLVTLELNRGGDPDQIWRDQREALWAFLLAKA